MPSHQAPQVGIIDGSKRHWVPTPQFGGGAIKILLLDEEAKRVCLIYRFEANANLPRHSHACTAMALTLSGEWEYDEGKLPVGSFAYEPFGSDHRPMSGPGADVFVTLQSTNDEFLVYHLDDGSTFPIDMAVLRELDSASRGLVSPAEHAA